MYCRNRGLPIFTYDYYRDIYLVRVYVELDGSFFVLLRTIYILAVHHESSQLRVGFLSYPTSVFFFAFTKL